MRFTVVLSPDNQGGYTAICPALPGAVSEGDSLDEALTNIKNTAEEWLILWMEEGNPTPEEEPAMVRLEVEACLRDRAEEGLPPTVETRQITVADEPELAARAVLDGQVLLEYGYVEGLYDDDEDGDDERALKPCTVRAILRYGGSLGDDPDGFDADLDFDDDE
ncbi:MAG: type II toxin-antitoxin system HicB family antitoxin [Chloroflexota bacterium]